MSFIQRISRAYATLSVPKLDAGVVYGQQGELDAGRIIAQVPGSLCIANPIVPHTRTGARVLEADYLVYAHGTLFCVEVKCWKNSIVTRKDAHTIISTKVGNYGERINPQERKDPLKQVRTFLYHFKEDLCKIDPRFRREHMVAVVAFSQKTDISALYDFEAGLITITDLPCFFQRHKSPHFTGKQSPWIVQALHKVYTWDMIETTRQETWKGILREQALLFYGPDGGHRLPLATVRTIQLQRSWLFSATDTMTVHFTNDRTETMACVSGELHLRLPGKQASSVAHKLRNVRTIAIGVANKRYDLTTSSERARSYVMDEI